MLLLPLALCLTASFVARARDPGVFPGPETTSAPAPAAPSVAARTQALSDRLEEIRARDPIRTLSSLEPEIGILEARAGSTTERVQRMLSGPARPGEIEAKLARVRTLERQLDKVQGRVQAVADLLDRTRAELDQRSDEWRATRAEARDAKAPVAVLGAIDAALAELSATNEQVGADLSDALEAVERLQEVRRAVQADLQRLEVASRAATQGMTVRQSEPLWLAIPTREALLEVRGQIATRLHGVWQELGEKLAERRDAIVVLVLAFLFLGWLLRSARAARLRLRGAEEESDPLRHPWSAALLIAGLLLPGLGLSHVRGLRLLLSLAGFVAYFRLTTRVLGPSLKWPLVGLIGLASLELFRFVLPDLPVLDRALLGAELVGATAGVLWLRRSGRPWERARAEATGPWLRLLDAWVRFVLLTLPIAVVALLLGYTALADRIALLAIWGSASGAGWVVVVRIAEDVAELAVESSRLGGALRMTRSSRPSLVEGLRRGLRLAGLFGWVYSTLGISGLRTPVRAWLSELLTASVGYGSLAVSLGSIVSFLLTIWISWLIARFVSFALEQEVFSRVRTAPGVSFALSTFVRYAVLVTGFMLAMAAIGFSLDRIALLLSALGVGVGFGLQSAVNNFVSGVILLFERPIRVGDWIQLDDLFGTVTVIGIRASRVRTFDGADVVVPNGDLVSSRVTNWTLSDKKRRIILPVGVAYGSDPRRVLEVLDGVARSHPDVLADPEPVVLFRGFGDSALQFEIRVFTEADWLVVMSDLATATNEALAAEGITIPFPQRDLHLRNVPEIMQALKAATAPDGAEAPRSG